MLLAPKDTAAVAQAAASTASALIARTVCDKRFIKDAAENALLALVRACASWPMLHSLLPHATAKHPAVSSAGAQAVSACLAQWHLDNAADLRHALLECEDSLLHMRQLAVAASTWLVGRSVQAKRTMKGTVQALARALGRSALLDALRAVQASPDPLPSMHFRELQALLAPPSSAGASRVKPWLAGRQGKRPGSTPQPTPAVEVLPPPAQQVRVVPPPPPCPATPPSRPGCTRELRSLDANAVLALVTPARKAFANRRVTRAAFAEAGKPSP